MNNVVNCERRTCHEDVFVPRDEEVEQIGIAHAVHGGDDQLAELEFRVVP